MYEVSDQGFTTAALTAEIKSATSAPVVDTQGELYTFVLPLSDIQNKAHVNFYIEVAGIEARRIINDLDPTTVTFWSFIVQPITRQRSSVTILNNVIDPNFGEETRVLYEIEQSSTVLILVADMAGKIVDVLYRGTKEPGEYYVAWGGRNRACGTADRDNGY